MNGGTSSATLHALPAPPVVEVAAVGPGTATGFVSIDGAALYLGMGRRFIEELLATRQVPSYKFGRSRRVRLADLEDWAAARKEH
jgi:excisionase family DNA binding protein